MDINYSNVHGRDVYSLNNILPFKFTLNFIWYCKKFFVSLLYRVWFCNTTERVYSDLPIYFYIGSLRTVPTRVLPPPWWVHISFYNGPRIIFDTLRRYLYTSSHTLYSFRSEEMVILLVYPP